jgi:ribosome-associated protein
MGFTVPLDEMRFRASRAGGPGGQHVNKAATRVEVRWNVARSPSLSERQRTRLLERLAGRIDARGNLRVVADERRSQRRNREAATARLRALVAGALQVRKPRKRTRPPRSAEEKRLAEKRRRAERKRRRRPVEGDD